MLHNDGKLKKSPASEQSQKEIAWLKLRLKEIKDSFYDRNKSKISRRIKKLEKIFEEIDKKVNMQYRQDFEWQKLHGIDLKDASHDKVWKKVDMVKLQSDLSPQLDSMMNCRNNFIFEEMQLAIKNELEKAKSTRYDSYKEMLKYTLNEINANKSIEIYFPCYDYNHFTSFPKSPGLVIQTSLRELSVFQTVKKSDTVQSNNNMAKAACPAVMSQSGNRKLC